MERATDLALAVATFVGVLAGAALAGEPVTYEATLPLAVVLSALVWAWRRWPLAALLISAATITAFRTSELTATGWIWPASVAYFAVAVAGRPRWGGLRWALGVGLFQLGFAASWEIFVQGGDPQAVLGSLGGELLWLAVVLSAAVAYRNQLLWREQASERARSEALRRAADERLRIARELHDVVAHTLTVVGLQLRVVIEALDDSPAEAREALRIAQEVRGQAVADLRALVGVLRDGGDAVDLAPPAGLDSLMQLIQRIRASGLNVELSSAGDLHGLPATVGQAIYRLVQESLTNAVRHAQATRVSVRLENSGTVAIAEVTDDGVGTPGLPGAGITGMKERVSALGGSFTAGPASGGGYAVRAEIPVPSSSL
ncbi:sensor histidine kinase [Catelliglobosispora koreensis]|uniref:sensor histidine kinase n=1 Tax=Catelliglobosispora koreensis TaxID=129052 RepID=UPI00058CDA26|nr:sensor histidine kinase [Catelliglobosispora koreensis]